MDTFTINQSDDDSARMIMKSSDHSSNERTRAHCLYLRTRDFTVMDAAEILDITPRTVINITTNYQAGGLEKAIKDDPRPGRPPVFDDRIKSKIIALVCSDPPEGFDRWTLELLTETVKKSGIVETISKETIRVILHEHDLKPWQHKMWCISEIDQEYIDRMEDVLDVYEQDYSKEEPVVCIDEKPVTLHSDKEGPIPARPGSIKKIDYEYERNGSANVFAMVEPKVGLYINKVTETKTADDFAEFMSDIAQHYKGVGKVRIVMDNYSTHSKVSLINRYGKKEGEKIWDKFEIHYTPVHASWLNQAEIAIGMYQRQCLGNTRIPNIETLEKKSLAWNRAINRKSVVIKWTFNKEAAREKLHY